MDGVVDTERDAVEVAAVGLLGAGAVEDQLVLGVADIDVRGGAAGVGAGGSAVGRAARALRLGNGLAVRDASDVGALAAVRAGPDGLEWRWLGSMHETMFLRLRLLVTHHKLASDIALEDGEAILGADILAEGALGGWGCHGRGGEGEDGGGELHFDVEGV